MNLPRSLTRRTKTRRGGIRLGIMIVVWMLVFAVGAGVAGAVADPASTQTASQRAVNSGPNIDLVGVNLPVARPGQTLELLVTVSNPGPGVLEDVAVELEVDWRRLTTRDEVAAWSAGRTERRLNQQAQVTAPPVGPDGAAQVRIVLPVDEMGLGAAAMGPRAMRLSLVSHGSGDTLASLNSFLVWDPGTAAYEGPPPRAPMRLTMLAPLTGPPVEVNSSQAVALDGLTTADGRLANLVSAAEAVADATEVSGALTLAVDPALAAEAFEHADQAVRDWGDRLIALGSALNPLPAFDPDLAAISRASLSTEAVIATTSAPLAGGWLVPTGWGVSLGWLADDSVPDLQTLALARQAGFDHVVVPNGLAPLLGTPTSLAEVRTSWGEVTALVSDTALSAIVLAATDSRQGEAAPTPALAAQLVLADTAIIAATSENKSPHLLVTLPRGWSPDIAALTAIVATLAHADWVEFAPTSQLLAEPFPSALREILAWHHYDAAELPPDQIRHLETSRLALERLSVVAADPTAITAPLKPGLVAPLSVAWRSDPLRRARAVRTAAEQVNHALEAFTLNVTDVMLISDRGSLPIQIANSLPVDAELQVVLEANHPRVTIGEMPVVTVPAGRQVRVDVPIEALGSGDVQITVTLLAPDGSPVATPISLNLRVRAGWETVGTAIAAGILALLAVAGVVRTIRRGRSATRTSNTVVSDPLVPEPRHTMTSID